MSTIQLTRQQRREMQKLAERVDRVAQADARFFERFPHRRHRVRLASEAEMGQYKIIDGRPVFLPPGCRFFVAVKNVATGARLPCLTLTCPCASESASIIKYPSQDGSHTCDSVITRTETLMTPDQVFFTRDQLLARLQERGYPLKSSSFFKMCLPSRNAGPPVAKWFGKRPLYRLEDAIAWAESKCRPASSCLAAEKAVA